MTAISGHTKQDVVVALVDGDNFWTKEGVIEGRDEEERLFDLVESVMDVSCFFEFVYIVITRLAIVDVR